MNVRDHIEKDCSDDEMLLVTQVKKKDNKALDCLLIKYSGVVETMIKNFGAGRSW